MVYSESGLTITYIVRASHVPLVDQDVLKEKISLEQHGIIEISSENEAPLSYFNHTFAQLKRLIEIASFRKANVEKVYAYSRNILYTIGDKTIERAVDIYGINILESKVDDSAPSHPWKWIGLQELIDHNSIALYFAKHDKLAPIIELFLEPFYADNCSKTRVCLSDAGTGCIYGNHPEHRRTCRCRNDQEVPSCAGKYPSGGYCTFQ